MTVSNGPAGAILINENSGVSSNDGVMCEGNQVTLTATGGSDYIWSGGISNPLVVSPEAGLSTYSVTISNGSGCSAVLSQEITVNVNPEAIIDFSNANQTVQEPQSIGNISTSNCGSLTSCSWTVEGSFFDSDCGDISPSFDSQGGKTISLKVMNSCGCTEVVTGNLEIVPANSCVTQEFSIDGSFDEACVGQAVIIVSNNSPSIGCQITEEEIDVLLNGLATDSYSIVGDQVTFLEVGT